MSTEDKNPKIKDSEVDDLIAEFGKPLTNEARDAILDKLAAERARFGLIDHALKNASEKEQGKDRGQEHGR